MLMVYIEFPRTYKAALESLHFNLQKGGRAAGGGAISRELAGY